MQLFVILENLAQIILTRGSMFWSVNLIDFQVHTILFGRSDVVVSYSY
jgi:hypothetical protein